MEISAVAEVAMAPISEWLIDETLLSSIFKLSHLPTSKLALQQPIHCKHLIDVQGASLKDQQVGLAAQILTHIRKYVPLVSFEYHPATNSLQTLAGCSRRISKGPAGWSSSSRSCSDSGWLADTHIRLHVPLVSFDYHMSKQKLEISITCACKKLSCPRTGRS